MREQRYPTNRDLLPDLATIRGALAHALEQGERQRSSGADGGLTDALPHGAGFVEAIEALRSLLLAKIDDLERATDPLSEIQAAFARRGVLSPVPVPAAAPLLSHLRAMRVILDDR